MSNQWGRESGGAAVRRRGAGGVLFASIVCLALGGAAGYGLLRLTQHGQAGGEIAVLDGRIADLTLEVEARAKDAEESRRNAEDLRRENDGLQRELESLRAESARPEPVPVAEGRLRQEIADNLEKELKLADQRIADAEALRSRAEETVRERERTITLQADRIARLEKEMKQAAETQGEADGLRRDLDAARAEAGLLRDEIARKEAEVAALGEEKKALSARIAALQETARAAGTRQAEEPARDNEKPAGGRSARNAALVALALEATPGLDRLSADQRGLLERALLSGECVTNALGAVFSRVPVLTLRNLMRDLESDC
jgi:predicted  nucleic acid-binding Zn-ribbon protein